LKTQGSTDPTPLQNENRRLKYFWVTWQNQRREGRVTDHRKPRSKAKKKKERNKKLDLIRLNKILTFWKCKQENNRK
jgi:hypothetical protein